MVSARWLCRGPSIWAREAAPSISDHVHLLQEEAEAIGVEHPWGRLPVEAPELCQHLADQSGDDAAVAGHVLEIDQPQRGPARVGGHSHRHPIDGAEHHAAGRGRQLVGVLEERPGICEEIPLAVRDAVGKGIAEGIDLRERGTLGEKLTEGGELALLVQLVGEGSILDGVEHAQEQIGEGDMLAKRSRELRDAERKAAAHGLEMALVELRRSHQEPPSLGIARAVPRRAAR